MKSSFITALSLVGVIGAGSAAALVNTSIFDSAPDAAQAAFVPEASIVELTLPTVANAAPTGESSLQQLADEPAEPASVAGNKNIPDQATSGQEVSVTDGTSSTPASIPVSSLSAKATPTTTTPPTSTTVAPTPEQPSLRTRYDLGGAGSVTVDVVNGRMTLIDATAAAGWMVTKTEVDAVANQVEVTLSDGSMIVDFEVGYVAGALVPEIRTEAVSSGYHDDDEDGHEEDEDEDDHDDDDGEDDEDDDDEDDDDEDEDDD